MSATSTKPYLLRALYEWCTDNGYTPHITVVVDQHTQVPREFVKAGEIVLNIGALATHQLHLGNDYVQFQARFGGVAREIIVPIGNISAIYARETGDGMAFEIEPRSPVESSDPAPQPEKTVTRSVLQAVPSTPTGQAVVGAHSQDKVQETAQGAVSKHDSSVLVTQDSETQPPKPPDPERPKLTRVK